ncbi:MAG TPA: lysylphosphatidylglycerol synthase domain-containing protein, partial [Clostridia bacterium]|nr:lysylphosphatidylglycerol synthase domain-containing protein [Clostridia bacterium]
SVYFLLYLAVSVMPTPGGVGFAEGGFYLVFYNLFPTASIVSALLLWRGITYYLLLFAGGIAIMADSVYKLILKKKCRGKKCTDLTVRYKTDYTT